MFRFARQVAQIAQAATADVVSPAAEYRRIQSKKAAPNAVKAIERVGLITTVVLFVGLIATYGHQAEFLAAIVGKLGLLIPGVFDLGMIAMMIQAQTVAMKHEAKRRATRVFVGLIVVSMLINVLASLPIELAHLGWVVEAAVFAITVAAVGAIKWAATAIGVDFTELENEEQAIAAPAQIIVTVAGCTHPKTCTTAAQCARKVTAAATRAANKAAAVQAKADAAQARKDAREARKQADAERAERQRLADAQMFAEIAVEMNPDYVDAIAPTSPAHATKIGH